MKNLNEKLLKLIKEIHDTFVNDSELPEVERDLKRVSKFLLKNELKKFDDGKNGN